MLPDSKVKCPATAFTRSCRDILHECDCPKFVTIRGRDPQTGTEIDRAGCVDSFLPLLSVEIAQQTRQAGAAIESFRNEVVKGREAEVEARREALAALARSGGPLLTVSK